MATELQSALAKVATSTKAACATSADVIQAAKPGTKIVITGAKTAILVHSIYLAALGGFIVGLAAYHFANKRWSNKDDTVKQPASELEATD